MSNNPRPEDDEKWAVDEELEEDVEADEEEYEADGSNTGFFDMTRRQTLGLGAAVLGLGGVAVAAYKWDGGDAYAPNTSTNTSDQNGTVPDMSYPGMTNPDLPDGSDSDVENGTENDTGNVTDTEPDPPEDESVYELEEGLTVDIDYLDPIFEDSSVQMGVQENGNLVAWNSEVEIEDEDGDTYSPLFRFRSDVFPDREFYEVEGDHPVEQIYSGLEEDVEEMTEGMVKVFYDEGSDEGSWEDHREYKPVGYDELKEGLLEHGGLGEAQDYFFNRHETLRSGEQTLEEEWSQLLNDAA